MKRKTYVLDTTVLLHDPNAIQKFDNSDVIMPLVVLEELDKMKQLANELGRNAQIVIRFIDELKGNLFEGIKLKNGGRFFLFHAATIAQKRGFPLPLSNMKHRILFAAYILQRDKEEVVLVSKDLVLRIKAESIGIAVQDHEKLKNSFNTLYKGHRKIELSKQQIDQLMVKGIFKHPGTIFCPNEYCHFFCEGETSLLGKYNSKKDGVELLSDMKHEIWGIKPLNDEQQFAIDLLMRDDVKLVSMIGQAGTGKTLIALICGLKKVFDEDVYKRIVISRPIMPLGKDIGYLPGTKEEKMYHWMRPIYDNWEYVCSNGVESKKWMIESEKIEMEALTYIRGRSLNQTFIIIDEVQNASPHEIKIVISRAGKGTKVVLIGDPTQIDNPYLDKDSNALTYVVSRFKSYEIYGHIFFYKTERSELSAVTAKVL